MSTMTNWMSSFLGFFYELTFGCRHNRQTRPFTLDAETYKVCLDCGRQIFYSSERMTPLTGREIRRMKAAQAEAGVLLHRAPHTMPTATAERKALAERGRKSTAAA